MSEGPLAWLLWWAVLMVTWREAGWAVLAIAVLAFALSTC